MAPASRQKTFEWMGIECPLFDRVCPRVEIPKWNLRDSEDVARKKAWEREELRRCLYGHGPFCGSYYFFYNYWWMADNQGVIRPKLRMTDNLCFMMEEKAERDCTGFIAPKKRRHGFTWRSAAYDTRGLLLNPYQRYGYGSKDEKTAREYLVRMKSGYARLPGFFKQGMDIVTDRIEELRFGTEKKGRNGDTEILHDSTMLVRAPTVNMWVQYGYGHVKQDEAGELEMDLSEWIDNTEPILAGQDSLTRNGYIGLFGAIGNMQRKAGQVFEKIYEQADAYRLMRFFVPGTFGMFMDEYGNDDFDAAREYIEHHRKQEIKKGKAAEIAFRQKYPLTIEDCFSKNSDKFFFNVAHLDAMKENILKASPSLMVGSFVMASNGTVKFREHREGEVKLLEEPMRGIPNAYVVGIDPIDNDADDEHGNKVSRFKKNKGKGKDQSDLAFVIRKRKTTLGPSNYPVGIFSARLRNVEDAYFQTVCAAIYFGCMINPEWNRQGFIIWCKLMGYTHLLMRGSHRLAQAKPSKTIPEFGYDRNGSTIDFCCDLQEKDLTANWDKQMFGELENSYRLFGNENADLCCADAAALLGCKHLDILEAKGSKNLLTARPDGHWLPVLKDKGGIQRWT